MKSGRKLHHFITQRHRFRLIQTILEHGEQLPSLYELTQFSPELDRSEVASYLEELVEEELVAEHSLPPADREPDLPHTFYGLTDHGWRYLMNHDLLESEGLVRQWQDVEVADPEKLARHEAAPRPDRDGNERHSRPGRKSQEQQLEEYKMVVERANDALYMLDAEGRYELVNAAYEELTGYAREDLIGESTAVILDPDAMTERRELIRDLLNREGSTSETWQTTIERADGETVPVEVKLSTLQYGDEFVGAIGAARDISERKRRQQELSVLSRVLRHNLGNKVNVMQGYAEIIEEETDPDDQLHQFATRIQDTADKLMEQSEKARDVHDILQEWPPEKRPVDITDTIWELVTDIESERSDVAISVSLPDTAWVRVPDEMEMAIEELLVNAIEHSDQSEPTVRATVEVEDEESVVVTVEDDGPGIPAEEQEVLTTSQETPLSHSRGIGLWLVKWIVTASDGRLTFAESDMGGSCVRMEFARTEPPALTLSM